ncbi:hypothetical protein [Leptolyngbya sp. UWPOB_LEPTO1]|uniref:hypothetical protein n=1 Tax=Leptolyngbya sp. UWPOB_LEPTO1 TaxID=2815653 RepID=UPI002580F163|nr:hypothetical protein [Leptolyngbya sp. UWPOB_LEPTO1]
MLIFSQTLLLFKLLFRNALLAREQATNRTLQMFIEHTPAAVAMLDRQMRYISASRRWMQEYAPDYTNLEGLSHDDVMTDIDIPDQWRQVHLRCLAGCFPNSTRQTEPEREFNSLSIDYSSRDRDGATCRRSKINHSRSESRCGSRIRFGRFNPPPGRVEFAV